MVERGTRDVARTGYNADDERPTEAETAEIEALAETTGAPGQRHTARGEMRLPATVEVGIWYLPFCGVVSPWCRCNTRGAGLGGRSERRYGDAFIVLRCSDVG